MRPVFSNILLIAGDGRNVGKTSFVVSIIRKFKDKKIHAVKVSPHFHPLQKNDKILFSGDHYQILEEFSKERAKDSSRFLEAGAEKVFYIQVKDYQLMMSFQKVFSLIPKGMPIVAEAGGLVRFLKPGLFIFMESNEQGTKNRQVKSGADLIVNLRDARVQTYTEQIEWMDDQWILKTD